MDHFVVDAPATATAGTAINLTVTAADAAGNTVTSYTGTILFSSSDTYATFAPSSYTFVSSDAGQKTFVGVAMLKAAGSLNPSDGVHGGISNTISVSAAAFGRLQILVPGETSVPGRRMSRYVRIALELHREHVVGLTSPGSARRSEPTSLSAAGIWPFMCAGRAPLAFEGVEDPVRRVDIRNAYR